MSEELPVLESWFEWDDEWADDAVDAFIWGTARDRVDGWASNSIYGQTFWILSNVKVTFGASRNVRHDKAPAEPEQMQPPRARSPRPACALCGAETLVMLQIMRLIFQYAAAPPRAHRTWMQLQFTRAAHDYPPPSARAHGDSSRWLVSGSKGFNCLPPIFDWKDEIFIFDMSHISDTLTLICARAGRSTDCVQQNNTDFGQS